MTTINRNIFDELFVLELANNHLGRMERGLRIIEDFSRVVRFNNIRAAIKLQIRDVDNFIHDDFKGNQDIRYIRKTEATRLTRSRGGAASLRSASWTRTCPSTASSPAGFTARSPIRSVP